MKTIGQQLRRRLMIGLSLVLAVCGACPAQAGEVPFDRAVGRAFSALVTSSFDSPEVDNIVSRAFTVFAGAGDNGEAPIESATGRAFTVFVGDVAQAIGIRSAASREFSVFAGELPVPRDATSRGFTVYVPQPDLQVTNFHLSGVVERGKTAEISWGVRNNGPSDAAVTWNDCFYLSTSNVLTGTATEISCTPAPRSLTNGEGYLSTAEVTLPNVSPGIYWLHLQADGGNGIGEDNEENNITSYGPFAINGDGEPVRILPELDTIFVAFEGGSDDTGYGTEDLPLRRLAFALQHAATYASAERPVRVQIAAGIYDDAFSIPRHVKLFGANPLDPSETIIRPSGDKLKGNDGVGIRIEGDAESVALRDVMLQFDDSAKGLDNATLLLVDDATAVIDNVIFDGGDVPSSTGMAAINPGSSDSSVTRCEFTGLTTALEIGDSGINVSRNTFDGIHGDALVITSGNKGTGDAEVPMLGSEDAPGLTGYNYFGEVDGFLLVNNSGTEVSAEMNDWGAYEEEEIEGGLVGPVDFMPFLGFNFFAASVFVSVVNESTLAPVFNATVRLLPGAWPDITAQVDGVYTIAMVSAGQYTVRASAPGYYEQETVVQVGTGNPIVPVTLPLPPDGTGGQVSPPIHHADTNSNARLDLSEILRGIQFYNATSLRCMPGTEDGYAPGVGDTATCQPHVGDYSPTDWRLTLSEVLRMVQIYNLQAYERCDDGEDGYCPGG